MLRTGLTRAPASNNDIAPRRFPGVIGMSAKGDRSCEAPAIYRAKHPPCASH